MTEAYRLDPLEVAAGRPLTLARRPVRLPTVPPPSPLAALEAAMLPALASNNCFVCFSGGRDSSAILAVAVDVARRHGLADPVPRTHRFPGIDESNESDWQDGVVRRLGLQEWDIRSSTSELDVLGPAAQRVLETCGVVYPFNAHFILELMDKDDTGTLLTGIGGDEILLPSANLRAQQVLTGQVRPRPSDALRLGLAAAPRPVRARVFSQRVTSLPWLTPSASQRVRRTLGQVQAQGRFWWRDDVLEDWLPARRRTVGLETLAALSAERGFSLVHPFHDTDFLVAVAEHHRRGFRTRDDAMAALFGHLLPAALLTRTSKASFSTPFFNAYSRDFVKAWQGGGVDEELVDVAALSRTWSAEKVDARSLSLLQSTWRRTMGFPGRQPV